MTDKELTALVEELQDYLDTMSWAEAKDRNVILSFTKSMSLALLRLIEEVAFLRDQNRILQDVATQTMEKNEKLEEAAEGLREELEEIKRMTEKHYETEPLARHIDEALNQYNLTQQSE